MNAKKYVLAALGVFVAYSVLGYLIHEVLLAADYAPLLGTVVRAEEEFIPRLPFLYLGNLVFVLAFCLVYVKGYEPGKGWIGQGLRFGLILAALLAPVAITGYVVYPVPGLLALKWVVLGTVQILVSALVAAGIYRAEA
ncbi:MAG: hypothetical protein HYY26_00865 [Acidobacteria bacterium]|nr:hypothetical protein [Acidobacteriota bacterium]